MLQILRVGIDDYKLRVVLWSSFLLLKVEELFLLMLMLFFLFQRVDKGSKEVRKSNYSQCLNYH